MHDSYEKNNRTVVLQKLTRVVIINNCLCEAGAFKENTERRIDNALRLSVFQIPYTYGFVGRSADNVPVRRQAYEANQICMSQPFRGGTGGGSYLNCGLLPAERIVQRRVCDCPASWAERPAGFCRERCHDAPLSFLRQNLPTVFRHITPSFSDSVRRRRHAAVVRGLFVSVSHSADVFALGDRGVLGGYVCSAKNR